MKNPRKKFHNNIEEMRKEALIYLKYLVYNKFKQNKKLNCFVLAMGTYCWIDSSGNVFYNHEVSDSFITDFIHEWDSILSLTGEGVKWFRNGEIITNW